MLIDVPSKCKRKNPRTKTTQPKNRDIRDMFKQIEECNKKHDEENESVKRLEK